MTTHDFQAALKELTGHKFRIRKKGAGFSIRGNKRVETPQMSFQLTNKKEKAAYDTIRTYLVEFEEVHDYGSSVHIGNYVDHTAYDQVLGLESKYGITWPRRVHYEFSDDEWEALSRQVGHVRYVFDKDQPIKVSRSDIKAILVDRSGYEIKGDIRTAVHYDDFEQFLPTYWKDGQCYRLTDGTFVPVELRVNDGNLFIKPYRSVSPDTNYIMRSNFAKFVGEDVSMPKVSPDWQVGEKVQTLPARLYFWEIDLKVSAPYFYLHAIEGEMCQWDLSGTVNIKLPEAKHIALDYTPAFENEMVERMVEANIDRALECMDPVHRLTFLIDRKTKKHYQFRNTPQTIPWPGGAIRHVCAAYREGRGVQAQQNGKRILIDQAKELEHLLKTLDEAIQEKIAKP